MYNNNNSEFCAFLATVYKNRKEMAAGEYKVGNYNLTKQGKKKKT